MSETFEQKAEAFLLAVDKEKETLVSYACSLTKDPDEAYDLYAETLLRCRQHIANGNYVTSSAGYMMSAIKFTFLKSQRKPRKYVTAKTTPDFIPLTDLHLEVREEVGVNEEENQMLVTGIMSYISSNFNQDEVAAFDLHVNGVSLEEIVFMSTAYKNKHQVFRVIQRIKKTVRAAYNQ